jgi:hypothetical protein
MMGAPIFEDVALWSETAYRVGSVSPRATRDMGGSQPPHADWKQNEDKASRNEV